MLKTVIFDFDGTIADSKELTVNLLNELADKYQFRTIRKEELTLLAALPIKERLKLLGLPLRTFLRMGFEMKKKYRMSVEALHAIEGIEKVVHDLKRKGLRISIVSSNSVENIKLFLQRNDLDVFDDIFSSGGVFGKHSAINRIMRQANLRKDEVIYIGDELRDIAACKKSGIQVIAVTWGFDSAELLAQSGPDFLVHAPREIADILQ